MKKILIVSVLLVSFLVLGIMASVHAVEINGNSRNEIVLSANKAKVNSSSEVQFNETRDDNESDWEEKSVRNQTENESEIENENETDSDRNFSDDGRSKFLSNSSREKIAEKINARTGLNLTAEDINNRTIIRALLSNGRWAEVKVMPETASSVALAKIGAKCEERNCSVELKETGNGNQSRPVYEIKAEKSSKLLLVFNKKMSVSAEVDAETGDVVSVHKPWWAFLAKED